MAKFAVLAFLVTFSLAAQASGVAHQPAFTRPLKITSLKNVFSNACQGLTAPCYDHRQCCSGNCVPGDLVGYPEHTYVCWSR